MGAAVQMYVISDICLMLIAQEGGGGLVQTVRKITAVDLVLVSQFQGDMKSVISFDVAT